uniref:pyruvate kinase n=1 Tax=Timema poppense TaxID=170557 RepID=A0A7R9HFZ3_TIMPO|nr:unnamed protein product [Timema poppensis]
MLQIHPEQPPGTVAKMQLGAAYADTLIDHMCQLDINSEASQERLTSIICTIGPACKEVAILEQMMEAGMNVARLNFSHGTHEYHAGTIANLKTAAMNYSRKINRVYPLAIALDTKGPEIRTGLLAAVGSVPSVR